MKKILTFSWIGHDAVLLKQCAEKAKTSLGYIGLKCSFGDVIDMEGQLGIIVVIDMANAEWRDVFKILCSIQNIHKYKEEMA